MIISTLKSSHINEEIYTILPQVWWKFSRKNGPIRWRKSVLMGPKIFSSALFRARVLVPHSTLGLKTWFERLGGGRGSSDKFFNFELLFLTFSVMEYYNMHVENSICELHKPHLCIYLDAPIDVAMERFKKTATVRITDIRLCFDTCVEECSGQWVRFLTMKAQVID